MNKLQRLALGMMLLVIISLLVIILITVEKRPIVDTSGIILSFFSLLGFFGLVLGEDDRRR
jgi:hypothetical protein